MRKYKQKIYKHQKQKMVSIKYKRIFLLGGLFILSVWALGPVGNAIALTSSSKEISETSKTLSSGEKVTSLPTLPSSEVTENTATPSMSENTTSSDAPQTETPQVSSTSREISSTSEDLQEQAKNEEISSSENEIQNESTKTLRKSNYSEEYLKTHFNISWWPNDKVMQLLAIKKTISDPDGERILIPSAYVGNDGNTYRVVVRQDFWNSIKNYSEASKVVTIEVSDQNNWLLSGGGSLSNPDFYSSLSHLFDNYPNLKRAKLGGLDFRYVTSVQGMFSSRKSLQSVTFVGNSNTSTSPDRGNSQLTDMSYMFELCSSLSSVIGLQKIDTSNVTNMMNMFYGCTLLGQLTGLENFNTSKVTTMDRMFQACASLPRLSLNNWDVSQVQTMKAMFQGCTNMSAISLSNWDTTNLVNASYMFYDTPKLNVSVNNFANRKLKDTSYMFYNSGITQLDWNSTWIATIDNMSHMFDSSQVESVLFGKAAAVWSMRDLSYMFANTQHLSSVDLQNWDIGNLYTVQGMFENSGISGNLDLSTWNKSRLIMDDMFTNTPNLRIIDLRNMPLDSNNVSTAYIIGTRTTNISALNQPLAVIVSSQQNPRFFGWDFISESGRAANPLVQLDANGGVFNNGNTSLSYADKICVSPEQLEISALDSWKNANTPTKLGYDFVEWSPSKKVTNPQSVLDLVGITYAAQYSPIKTILPNIDNVNEKNTINNNLGSVMYGIAYQPKYLAGSGKILDLNGNPILDNRVSQGLFYISPTNDSQGSNPADITHVGVKDRRNVRNKWELQASLKTNMPGTQLFFEDPEVKENQNGQLIETQAVVKGDISSKIMGTNNGHKYLIVPSGSTYTIMRANRSEIQNGEYDFAAKSGLLINNNADIAAGDYTGTVTWSLVSAP